MDLPNKLLPNKSWEHYDLYSAVRDVLKMYPEFLVQNVGGYNRVIGTTFGNDVERWVAPFLNRFKHVWDPTEKYGSYDFFYQPGSFPDLTLRNTHDHEDCILGIEVKSWYVYAEESQPTFRLNVGAENCNPQDLLFVVAYSLDAKGTLVVPDVYVDSLKYCVTQRNYHWTFRLNKKLKIAKRSPSLYSPCRTTRVRITDRPEDDRGNNFGRIARCRIPEFDEWQESTLKASKKGSHAAGLPSISESFDINVFLAALI